MLFAILLLIFSISYTETIRIGRLLSPQSYDAQQIAINYPYQQQQQNYQGHSNGRAQYYPTYYDYYSQRHVIPHQYPESWTLNEYDSFDNYYRNSHGNGNPFSHSSHDHSSYSQRPENDMLISSFNENSEYLAHLLEYNTMSHESKEILPIVKHHEVVFTQDSMPLPNSKNYYPTPPPDCNEKANNGGRFNSPVIDIGEFFSSVTSSWKEMSSSSSPTTEYFMDKETSNGNGIGLTKSTSVEPLLDASFTDDNVSVNREFQQSNEQQKEENLFSSSTQSNEQMSRYEDTTSTSQLEENTVPDNVLSTTNIEDATSTLFIDKIIENSRNSEVINRFSDNITATTSTDEQDSSSTSQNFTSESISDNTIALRSPPLPKHVSEKLKQLGLHLIKMF
ncbi:hypothetical protein DICVIV_12650 [Dictyocaulus viviparus]|uniref:Uncharacterized protein n=1 Tax=Dictyocaulus viviparus TaxID=29172 RepID=A0A0D8XCJ5_DICVI|nr:hypothetical protein DICVIV_12650 [Dictyocaulus viviparus]